MHTSAKDRNSAPVAPDQPKTKNDVSCGSVKEGAGESLRYRKCSTVSRAAHLDITWFLPHKWEHCGGGCAGPFDADGRVLLATNGLDAQATKPGEGWEWCEREARPVLRGCQSGQVVIRLGIDILTPSNFIFLIYVEQAGRAFGRLSLIVVPPAIGQGFEVERIIFRQQRHRWGGPSVRVRSLVFA